MGTATSSAVIAFDCLVRCATMVAVKPVGPHLAPSGASGGANGAGRGSMINDTLPTRFWHGDLRSEKLLLLLFDSESMSSHRVEKDGSAVETLERWRSRLHASVGIGSHQGPSRMETSKLLIGAFSPS